MIPEFLLIFACLNQSGCAETASQYRIYNPTPFTVAEQYTERFNQMVLLNYWGPVLAYGLGREGTVKLHRNVGLTLSQKKTGLLLSFDF